MDETISSVNRFDSFASINFISTVTAESKEHKTSVCTITNVGNARDVTRNRPTLWVELGGLLQMLSYFPTVVGYDNSKKFIWGFDSLKPQMRPWAWATQHLLHR